MSKVKVVVNVGTIGHVDHGKTTLTAALIHALDIAGVDVEVVEHEQWVLQAPEPAVEDFILKEHSTSYNDFGHKRKKGKVRKWS